MPSSCRAEAGVDADEAWLLIHAQIVAADRDSSSVVTRSLTLGDTIGRMSDTGIVSVGPKGRVVIPAGIRRRLGIEEGSELVALVEGEAVVLVPRSAIKSRLRSMFADVGVSMRDELIAERRAEAVRESAEGA